jgi:hypothetical protein
MRTTLAIDDDVLIAANAMATQQQRSVGEVISELARRSLRRPRGGGERNGIPLLSARPDAQTTLTSRGEIDSDFCSLVGRGVDRDLCLVQLADAVNDLQAETEMTRALDVAEVLVMLWQIDQSLAIVFDRDLRARAAGHHDARGRHFGEGPSPTFSVSTLPRFSGRLIFTT